MYVFYLQIHVRMCNPTNQSRQVNPSQLVTPPGSGPSSPQHTNYMGNIDPEVVGMDFVLTYAFSFLFHTTPTPRCLPLTPITTVSSPRVSNTSTWHRLKTQISHLALLQATPSPFQHVSSTITLHSLASARTRLHHGRFRKRVYPRFLHFRHLSHWLRVRLRRSRRGIM